MRPSGGAAEPVDDATTASELLSAIGGVVTFLLVVAVWAAWKAGLLLPAENSDAARRADDEEEALSDDAHVHGDSVPHIAYMGVPALSGGDMVEATRRLYAKLSERRSVRHIASEPVPPLAAIEYIVKCAGTSPSGANLQPWTFAVLSPSDSELRMHVRTVIEQEEQVNYERRMGDKWVKDVAKLFTTAAPPWEKAYLSEAPYLIIVLKRVYELNADGSRQTTYYNEISTAIATGLLITAIHEAALVTVPTTPMNCGPSLCRLLQRPANEKVLLLLPVGRPATGALVPDLKRKPLAHIMHLY